MRLHNSITLLIFCTAVALAGLTGWQQRQDTAAARTQELAREAEARLLWVAGLEALARDLQPGKPRRSTERLGQGFEELRLVRRLGGRWLLQKDWSRQPLPATASIDIGPAGHRARRTQRVQSEVRATDEGFEIHTAAPVFNREQHLLGLLLARQRLQMARLAPSPWPALLWATAGALVLSLLLRQYLLLPLRRLQLQLRERELLDPADVAHPDDILREVVRVLDKSESDRSWFEARIRQLDEVRHEQLRQKEEMVANVVHELRTPLSSVIASVELLRTHRDRMNEAEQLEFLDQSLAAGRHLMFVVNDLLDSAAAKDGRISVDLGVCPIQSMLADAQRAMDSLAAGRGMQIQVEEAPQEILVRADQARVMQVIFNLVSNAVKYSPDGSTITLRARIDGERACVEIEDQGEVIPTAMRHKLFSRFSRLPRHATAAQSAAGSSVGNSNGIGLYLSKKLIELMDGRIGYRPGRQGSCFWFSLPCASTAQIETAQAPPAD